jgi:hypothetical protein
MRAQEDMLPWNELKVILGAMGDAILIHDQVKLRILLIQAVPLPALVAAIPNKI